MANKKFSEFTSQTDSANVQFVVGYNGSDNVRISPSNLLGAYLPLAGGTLTGNLILDDGAGSSPQIQFINANNDTGEILLNTSGKLEIQTGGTDRLVISSGDTEFTGDISLADNKKALFGAGSDLEIFHDATDSYLTNATGDLIIQNTTDDKDIIFQSDDGAAGVATYFFLDGSKVNGSSILGATVFPDKSKIYVGTSGDLEIFHNGSQTYIENYSGTFNITQHTNDGDIVFKCDDGSGGVTSYLTFDGSTTHSYFSAGNVGIGTTAPTSKLQVVGLAEHADNSAATTAGLTAGAFYRTGDLLKVVH